MNGININTNVNKHIKIAEIFIRRVDIKSISRLIKNKNIDVPITKS